MEGGTIGEIRMFAGNFAPKNWRFCEGQSLKIASFTALFSIIGTSYGGDGRTTFNLPDLRARLPIHPGTLSNETNKAEISLGKNHGQAFVKLQESNLPAHSHIASVKEFNAKATPFASNSNSLSGTLTNAANGLYIASSGKQLDIFEENTSNLIEMAKIPVEFTDADIHIEESGSNEAYENIPPVLGINYIICVDGFFPSKPADL